MPVVNIKGRRLKPDEIYIGRNLVRWWKKDGLGPEHFKKSLFHNPFTGPDCLEKFRAYAIERCAIDSAFHMAVLGLKGKTLACWCKPKPCHGDILLELAEGKEQE